MVAAIKEICIFVMIAQAILFLVPGNSYMKYVRVLVGIIMILKVTEPFFALFLDPEKEEEIRQQVLLLEQNMEYESAGFVSDDQSREIYEGTMTELKNRLNGCESGYRVLQVQILEDQKLLITLEKEEEGGQEDKELIRVEQVQLSDTSEEEEKKAKDEEALKERLGECIGVAAEYLELRYQ